MIREAGFLRDAAARPGPAGLGTDPFAGALETPEAGPTFPVKRR